MEEFRRNAPTTLPCEDTYRFDSFTCYEVHNHAYIHGWLANLRDDLDIPSKEFVELSRFNQPQNARIILGENHEMYSFITKEKGFIRVQKPHDEATVSDHLERTKTKTGERRMINEAADTIELKGIHNKPSYAVLRTENHPSLLPWLQSVLEQDEHTIDLPAEHRIEDATFANHGRVQVYHSTNQAWIRLDTINLTPSILLENSHIPKPKSQ